MIVSLLMCLFSNWDDKKDLCSDPGIRKYCTQTALNTLSSCPKLLSTLLYALQRTKRWNKKHKQQHTPSKGYNYSNTLVLWWNNLESTEHCYSGSKCLLQSHFVTEMHAHWLGPARLRSTAAARSPSSVTLGNQSFMMVINPQSKISKTTELPLSI